MRKQTAMYKRWLAMLLSVSMIMMSGVMTTTDYGLRAAEDDPYAEAVDGQNAEGAATGDVTVASQTSQEAAMPTEETTESAAQAETPVTEAPAEDTTVAMPAQNFRETSPSGIVVDASAPEGVFPEGTTMKVTDVAQAKANEVAEKAAGNSKVKDAVAVDITFYDKDGNKIEPADAQKVTVKLSLKDSLKGNNFVVAHEKTDGSVEKINADKANKNGSEFKADSFTVYAQFTVDEPAGEEAQPEEENKEEAQPENAAAATQAQEEQEAVEDTSQYDNTIMVGHNVQLIVGNPAETYTDGKHTYYHGGKWSIKSGKEYIQMSDTAAEAGTHEQFVYITGSKVGEAVVVFTSESGNEYEYTIHVEADPDSDEGHSVKDATLQGTLKNAQAMFLVYHNKSDADISRAIPISGSVHLNDYVRRVDGKIVTGYVVVFVKPDKDYLLTGLGAMGGNGKIYSVDGPYESINNYPEIKALAQQAKAMGYVACFGWSRGATWHPTDKETLPFTVEGQQPQISVTATPEKTTDIGADEPVNIQITITADQVKKGTQVLPATKTLDTEDVVAKINGQQVEITDLQPVAGTDNQWTANIQYTLSENDLKAKNVTVAVDASVEYSYSLSAGTNGAKVMTSATINSSDSATCVFAKRHRVNYIIPHEGYSTYPDRVLQMVEDDHEYIKGQKVTVKTDLQDGEMVDDPVNSTVWTFDGWYDGAKKIEPGETFTMPTDDVFLQGRWVPKSYANIVLTAKADDTNITYDGNEHKATTFTASSGVDASKLYGMNKDGSIVPLQVTGSGTEVGTYKATFVSKPYYVTDGKNIYNAKYIESTFKINKRQVTLTSASDRKFYDGSALTNETVTRTGDAFLANDGVTYKATGSQLVPGTSKNTIEWSFNNPEMEKNYKVTTKEGDLEVAVQDSASKKLQITVTANSSTDNEYDGEEKSVSGLTQTEFTVNGHKYTVEGLDANATLTNAGTVSVPVTGTAVVRDEFGNDVTSAFNVKTVAGTLKILPRKVTLTSGSATKEYDGEPLRNDEVTVTSGSFVGEDGFTAWTTREQLNVGGSNNNFEYTLNEGTLASNYEITKQRGWLSVTNRSAKYQVEITLPNDTVTYDGTEQSVGVKSDDKFTVTASNGKKYTVFGLKGSAKGTNVGTYTYNNDRYAYPIVNDENGTNVSNQFNVTINPGTLTINPRKIKITSASDEKTYDGTELVAHDVTLDGSFAMGEGASYNFTGTQTFVGESDNTFSYTLNDNTDFRNYEITTAAGKLNVTDRAQKYEITVEANSSLGNKYDGTAKTASGLVTTSFVKNGVTYTVEGLDANVSKTNAGTYEVPVTGTARVLNGTTDVTKQFKVDTVAGSLEIAKRKVTLTSASAEKEYDGDALTTASDAVTVSGDGFAEGEGASYNVTGTQTLVGISDNTFDYTLNDGTLAKNYEITKDLGTLNVKNRDAKYEVVINGNTATETYDGQKKTVSGIANDGVFTAPNGKEYTVTGLTGSVSGTDANTYEYTLTGTPVVTDKNGKDVTDQFAITAGKGSLNIKARKITMTSATPEAIEYNGTVLKAESVEVTGDGFVSGEGATYTFTGQQSAPGTSKNTFGYELTNAKAQNYNIKTVYGDLTVNDRAEKYAVTVVANSDNAKYDATEKSVSGLVKTQFTVDGHDYTVSGLSASAAGTDAGTYTAEVTGTPVVTDQYGNDVTSQFKVKRTDGSLNIGKRSVVLTSASDSKEYDGNELVNNTVDVTGDGFVAGQGADYAFTGTQTLAGFSDNTFTYTLKDGATAANYNVTTKFGTLTVTNRDAKYQIEVEANSATEKYDGSEKTVKGLKETSFTVDGNEYTVSGLSASAAATNAGEYAVNVTGTPVVKDANGNNVSDQFAVTAKAGTLNITKRNVTLTSADADKQYDGSALTDNTVTVSGDDFAEGEGATYDVTGSITLPGEADNDFTYALNSKTNADNYNITVVPGTLKINNRTQKYAVTVTAKSDSKKYDGTALTVTGIENDKVTADNGLEYTVVANGTARTETKAGTYSVAVDTDNLTVLDAAGNDVTAQFAVNGKNGTLTIEKRNVTLTSGSATRAFDPDEALTNDEVTVSEDGFATNEGVEYIVEGSQMEVGSSENNFGYVPNDKTDLDNYKITKEYGTLTVTAHTLTIHYQDAEGNTLAEDQSGVFAPGEAYNFTTPVVEGYTPEATVVEGAMPATKDDVEVTVVYNVTPQPAPVIPPTPVAGTPAAIPAAIQAPIQNAGAATVVANADGTTDLVQADDVQTARNLQNLIDLDNILPFIFMLMTAIVLMAYSRSRKKDQEELFDLSKRLEELSF